MMSPALLSLLAALLLLFIAYRTHRSRSAPRRTPLEAEERVRAGEAMLLDVRTDGERRGGQISGSAHVPLHMLRRRADELKKYKTREIICYCQTGSRSLRAAAILRRGGFNASSMDGGIGEWNFSRQLKRSDR